MTCMEVVYSEDSMVNQQRRKERRGKGEVKYRKVLILRVCLVPLTGMEERLDGGEVCNCARKRRSEADTNVTDLIAGYKELIVCTN
jgi:hypothetical protein